MALSLEGELVALVFNPDLRMARQQAKVTEAKIPYVGLWQDPVFNLNILNIAERIPDLGISVPRFRSQFLFLEGNAQRKP